MANGTIQITRYPNRRLYVRDQSKYVSLEDIEALVRQGQSVEIRDSQTEEDLTGLVLTRLILERQPEKMHLFPIDMLHFMLRSNEAMSDFLRDYFRLALPYMDYLQRHGATALNVAQKPVHWIKAWLDNLVSPNSPSPKPVQSGDNADQLALRVAELEERLRQLEAQRKN